MDLFGAEVFGPVDRQQIASLVEDEVFQALASLHLAEDIVKGRAQFFGLHGIENGAHFGIAWDAVDSEEAFHVGIISAFLEGEEGGIFQGEHGEGGHERVGEGDGAVASSRVGDLSEGGLDLRVEGIGAEVSSNGYGWFSSWFGHGIVPPCKK